MNTLIVTGATRSGIAWAARLDGNGAAVRFGRYLLRANFTTGRRGVSLIETA